MGLWITTLNAQNPKIDNTNYFEYYNKIESGKTTTNWLTKTEIANIIFEELEKYNFKHNYDNVLYQIPNESIIVLDVFSRKLNIGFLIQTGHYAIPQKDHRTKKIYDSVKYDHEGKMERFEIDQLPENIHLLLETNYWYQYGNSKDEINNAVCKLKIIEIIKKDIEEILSNYKNLEEAISEKEWIGIPTDLSSLKLKGFINWAEFLDGQNGVDNYFNQEIKKLIKVETINNNEEFIAEYWVNIEGKIENVKLTKGGSSSFAKEVKRIIENMPSWKPARNDGKSISTKYVQTLLLTKD